jgi:hypothetical protein
VVAGDQEGEEGEERDGEQAGLGRGSLRQGKGSGGVVSLYGSCREGLVGFAAR